MFAQVRNNLNPYVTYVYFLLLLVKVAMILVDDFSDLSQNQKSELVEIFGMTLLNFQKNSKLVGIRSILAIKKQFFQSKA